MKDLSKISSVSQSHENYLLEQKKIQEGIAFAKEWQGRQHEYVWKNIQQVRKEIFEKSCQLEDKPFKKWMQENEKRFKVKLYNLVDKAVKPSRKGFEFRDAPDTPIGELFDSAFMILSFYAAAMKEYACDKPEQRKVYLMFDHLLKIDPEFVQLSRREQAKRIADEFGKKELNTNLADPENVRQHLIKILKAI